MILVGIEGCIRHTRLISGSWMYDGTKFERVFAQLLQCNS